MVQADELGERQTGACSPGRGRGSECVLAFFCIFLVCLHQEELTQLLSVSGPGLCSLSALLKTVNPSSNPNLPPVSLSALKKGAAAACQEDLGLPRWDTQASDCVVCPPSFSLSPLRKRLPHSLASPGGTKRRQAALSWLSHCSLRI